MADRKERNMTFWNASSRRGHEPESGTPAAKGSGAVKAWPTRRWLVHCAVTTCALTAIAAGGYVLAAEQSSSKTPGQASAPHAGASSAPGSSQSANPGTAGGQSAAGQTPGGATPGAGDSAAAAPADSQSAGRGADSERSTGLLEPGQLIVSGFSGTYAPEYALKRAVSAPTAKNVFINLDGAVLRVFDVAGVRAGGVGARQGAVEVLSLSARRIGQVFGIALDDTTTESGKLIPNIFVAATSAFGLHIVAPNADGTARRIVQGRPGATYMEGLFGEGQAGPGTIWRIDGVTGDVTPFADIKHGGQPNSGPGLGNLAYDPVSRQLFVSDLDTGRIHRLDMGGGDLGSFDHGVTARKQAGLEAVPHDPNDRAHITTEAFLADDPSTWGFAHPARRVWGLALFGRRLYYAVAAGPEIWSVAINPDGSFGAARRELQLPQDIEPFEIADIAFSSRGEMVLAQRPPVTGAQDYVALVAQGPARVLRYRLDEQSKDSDTPRWLPTADEYAVGKKAEYRFTSGSVSFGYAHKPEGGLDFTKCGATLWTTGDGLSKASQLPDARVVQARHESVSSGLSGVIDGLQGIGADMVRPQAVPPKSARFFDYDGLYLDQGSRGQVGAVRVLQDCGRTEHGTKPAAWWHPSYGKDASVGRGHDLKLTKTAIGSCIQGGSICRFRLTFRNRGPRTFVGPLLLQDTLPKPGAVLVGSNPSPWVCTQAGAISSCHRPTVLLKPGRKLTLTLAFKLPVGWPSKRFRNCARINWLANATPGHRTRTVALELARLGYYGGPSTSIMTPALQQAIIDYQGDKGLSADGLVSNTLLDALFGAGAGYGKDNDPSNDRDCATHRLAGAIAAGPFQLPSPDQILPALPPPLPISAPGPRRCPWGKIRWRGRCISACAPGFKLTGGRCRPICWGGKYFNGRRCVCPVNKVYNPLINACVRRGRLCPVGMKKIANRCVCRAGRAWSWRRQACVPIWRPCPPFYTRRAGICIPIIKIGHCPVGFRKHRGRCVSIIPGKACLPGQRLRNGKCIFVFNPRPCPFGTTRRKGRCQPLVIVGGNKCPFGQVRRGGKCKLPGKIGWCPPGLLRTAKGCKPGLVKIKGKLKLKRPVLHKLPPKAKVVPGLKLGPVKKGQPKLKGFPKAKIAPGLKLPPVKKGQPKLKRIPKAKIAPGLKLPPVKKGQPKLKGFPKAKIVPKGRIVPKGKLPPKVKLAPKQKGQPKIRLVPKTKAPPKRKLAPKVKLTPKVKIAPKLKAAPKRRIVPKKRVVPKLKVVPKKRARPKPKVRQRVKTPTKRLTVRKPPQRNVIKRTKPVRKVTIKRKPPKRVNVKKVQKRKRKQPPQGAFQQKKRKR